MKKLLLIIVSLLASLHGIALIASTGNQQKFKKIMNNKKILIVYFSWSGHTKSLAEKIHSRIGGDILVIEPTVAYPNDYNETAYGIAKTQKEQNIHPEIKDTKNTDDYGIIFLGTPVWWYTMAPPTMTFLEKNNFEGKTIIPFISHGGGGGYTIQEEISKLAKGAEVLSPLVIYESGNSETDEKINKWLKKSIK